MKRIIYFLGVLVLGLIAYSCERDTESVSFTDDINSFNAIGQWEVTAHNDSAAIFGPFTLLTVNDPEASNDSIIVQDSELKFWNFQVKAALNNENGTFQTELSTCDVCEEGIGVKIANGKIVNSDSIYLEIQFEDDETPYGNTYQLKGRRVANG